MGGGRSVGGIGGVGGVGVGWAVWEVCGLGAGCEVCGWSGRNGRAEGRDWWAGEVGG